MGVLRVMPEPSWHDWTFRGMFWRHRILVPIMPLIRATWSNRVAAHYLLAVLLIPSHHSVVTIRTSCAIHQLDQLYGKSVLVEQEMIFYTTSKRPIMEIFLQQGIAWVISDLSEVVSYVDLIHWATSYGWTDTIWEQDKLISRIFSS